MTNALSFRAFNRRWLAEFEKHAATYKSGRRVHDHWQGSFAYAEFHSKGLLGNVIFDPQLSNDPVTPLQQHIFREVETYGRLTSRVVRHNYDFKQAIDCLKSAERRFLKEKNLIDVPRLKYAFEEIATFLAAKRIAIQKDRETYWKDILLVSPDDRRKWSIDMDTLEQIEPGHVRRFERIFRRNGYTENDLVKSSDLDRRFQVRLGTVLRAFFNGVSLSTIARLVVLCYICAEFVEQQERCIVIGQLKDKSSKRNQLTVDATYQKLRGANLR